MNTIDSSHRIGTANTPAARIHRVVIKLLGSLALALAPALCAGQAVVASANPQDTVAALNRDMVDAATAHQGGEDQRARNQRLERVASAHADFAYTSQLVLGKAWSGATREQREGFTAAFRSMLLATFSDQLVRNAQAQTVVEAPRLAASGHVAEVRTQIAPLGESTQQVNYRLRKAGGGWKLFDVVVDGVGLVAVYKGSIRSRASRLGLDGLIRELEAHNHRQHNI